MIFYPGHLEGTMAAPASKSEAHRSMICAGLTHGDTTLDGFMHSDDMEATGACLTGLGTTFTHVGDQLVVHGHARHAANVPVMDCGESGSTLRFFVPIALSMTKGGIFVMRGRLSQRPMDVYRDLFVPQGVEWRMGEGIDGAAELTVKGSFTPGDYVLPGNVSSQFVSGMMFALPLLSGDSTLTVIPPVESVSYIRMTVKALEDSGIKLEEVAPFSWKIPGHQSYHAKSGRLSGDYSQAAVMLCAGALGHNVTVTGLSANTTQGDRAVLDCLRQMGATVTETAEGITVQGGSLHGAVLSMHDHPDIAPILALTCALAEGESRLQGCGRLRLKESDRLAATVNMLNALGAQVTVEGDDMLISGVKKLTGGVSVDTCGDHRMVMLASIAATMCEKPIAVNAVEALNKSWPDYVTVYKSLGGKAE